MKWTSSSQHSRGFDVANLRFMLTGPAAFITLALFGLYFWGLRLIGKTLLRYPWALLVGVPFAISNIIYNVVFASFVFWRFPVWLNTRGQFSPFFTTRIKSYRREAEDPLVEYLAGAINRFDPGHFAK